MDLVEQDTVELLRDLVAIDSRNPSLVAGAGRSPRRPRTSAEGYWPARWWGAIRTGAPTSRQRK
jgi:hypothetical protein